jgi:hypothetical protein
MGALSRTIRRAILLPVLLVLALHSTGSAQQRAVKIDDLAKRAEVVAIGRVTGLESQWNQDRTRIFTVVTVEVDEYLKGGDGTTQVITIQTPGGEIGEVGELYTHVPSFRQSENIVVFLEKGKQTHYSVSGGPQGKYSIEKDPESGLTIVAGKATLAEFSQMVRKAAK